MCIRDRDDNELLSLTDFSGKIVMDIGAGTGKLAFVAAKVAKIVYGVEPVDSLRWYMRSKAKALNLDNFYAVDGLIEKIPFGSDYADIVVGGHVFGDFPDIEYAELERVVKNAGMIILCPGNNDEDNDRHRFLVDKGFSWSVFEEPEDGMKRKYWKTISKF